MSSLGVVLRQRAKQPSSLSVTARKPHSIRAIISRVNGNPLKRQSEASFSWVICRYILSSRTHKPHSFCFVASGVVDRFIVLLCSDVKITKLFFRESDIFCSNSGFQGFEGSCFARKLDYYLVFASKNPTSQTVTRDKNGVGDEFEKNSKIKVGISAFRSHIVVVARTPSENNDELPDLSLIGVLTQLCELEDALFERLKTALSSGNDAEALIVAKDLVEMRFSPPANITSPSSTPKKRGKRK